MANNGKNSKTIMRIYKKITFRITAPVAVTKDWQYNFLDYTIEENSLTLKI